MRPVSTLGATAGVLAAVIFVLTFSVAGWVRPGYRPASMFVSELSLGPGGWVQRGNFLVSGALVVVFAVAVRRALVGGRWDRAIPVTLALLGLCLAGSGVFTTDPSAMFTQVTAVGRVHGLLGAVVFTAMPVSCFLFASRLGREPGGRAAARWSRVTGAAQVTLIVLLKISEFPSLGLFDWKGLVQRLDLIVFLTWLAALAVHLRRERRGGRLHGP